MISPETKKKIEEAAKEYGSDYLMGSGMRRDFISGATFGYSLCSEDNRSKEIEAFVHFNHEMQTRDSEISRLHKILKEKDAEIAKLKELSEASHTDNEYEALQIENNNLRDLLAVSKDETHNAIKAMDHHINCDMTTQEQNAQLKSALKIAEEALAEIGNKVQFDSIYSVYYSLESRMANKALQSIHSMREGE